MIDPDSASDEEVRMHVKRLSTADVDKYREYRARARALLRLIGAVQANPRQRTALDREIARLHAQDGRQEATTDA